MPYIAYQKYRTILAAIQLVFQNDQKVHKLLCSSSVVFQRIQNTAYAYIKPNMWDMIYFLSRKRMNRLFFSNKCP